MAIFSSDSETCALSEAMGTINAANSSVSASYRDDEWSSGLQVKLSEIFKTDKSSNHAF